MMRWERRDSRESKGLPTLEITNRFPILIGLESAVANRCSQLRGNFVARPPNFLISADVSVRGQQTISSSRRLRPGLWTTTSWP